MNVIKQLTVWYLRRLSEKKQKPCFLLLCLEGGFLLPSLPALGDIADMNQNLSKGFLIRLKVKTLILRHSFEKCCKKNSDLGLNKLHLFKFLKWIASILELKFFQNSTYLTQTRTLTSETIHIHAWKNIS